jgi:hypothetical protein
MSLYSFGFGFVFSFGFGFGFERRVFFDEKR